MLQSCRYANLQRPTEARTRRSGVRSSNGFNRLFPSVDGWAGIGGGQGAASDPERTLRALQALAEARRGSRDSGAAPAMPAGYSYLAQLVVHDLSFTRTVRPIGAEQAVDVTNIRSPRLDLDCIYGDGWQIDTHLFRRDGGGPSGRCLFRLGSARPMPDHAAPPASDFARIADDAGDGDCFDPLVADVRNDVHLILSQLTLLFMRLHNRVAELATAGRLRGHGPALPERAFEIAHRFVVLTYRGIVIADLLPRLVRADVLEHCLTHGSVAAEAAARDSLPDEMPYEFAFAGARAGHALARNAYEVNELHRLAPIRALARFSALSKRPDLPVPADWVVAWHHFFAVGHRQPQAARLMSPFYCPDFIDRRFEVQFDVDDPPLLAGRQHSISFLDLYRCYRNVPTGQDCARALAAAIPAAVPLQPEEMLPGDRPHGQNAAQARALATALNDHPELLTATPLSYYVLQEALVREGGARLGPLGSYIFAETVVRALRRSLLEEIGRGSQIVRPHPTVPTMAAMIRLINGTSSALVDAVDATLPNT